jgi:hypothetical protein
MSAAIRIVRIDRESSIPSDEAARPPAKKGILWINGFERCVWVW